MVLSWTRAAIRGQGAVSSRSETSSPEEWENSEATSRDRKQRRREHWEESY